MALFKVSKGLKANLPSAKTEGYCWYTTDDSLFYIDYKDENGSLQRKALNAKDAETLTGASLSTILNSSDVEIPTSKAVLNALNEKLDKADAGSDWNQNDNTKPDYVKNRPFYTGDPVETVMLPETTITIVSGGENLISSSFSYSFELGKTYVITFDGVDTEYTAYEVQGLVLVGDNFSSVAGGSGYVVMAKNESIVLNTMDSSLDGSHTIAIKIYNQEIVKVDEKYLPESAFTYAEWSKISNKIVDYKQQSLSLSVSGEQIPMRSGNSYSENKINDNLKFENGKTYEINGSITLHNPVGNNASVLNINGHYTCSNGEIVFGSCYDIHYKKDIRVSLYSSDSVIYQGMLCVSSAINVANTSFTFDINITVTGEAKQLPDVCIGENIQRVGDDIILSSSTPDSTKQFKITVDDDYNVSATNTSDSVSKTLATTEYVDNSVSNPLNITSATVGQIAKISAVDDTGKPTTWETVDMHTPFKPEGKSYLTFSSPNSFTLAVNDATKHWDGTLEYFDSDKTWTVWNGTTTLSAVDNDGERVLYLRGTGNTKITGLTADGPSDTYRWVLTGSDIACVGNIENLLDYATVESGQHPTMAEACYGYMFQGCTGLTKAPALPATTLESNCYRSMFSGCASLTKAPALPATTLANYCYYQMFQSCTSLIQAPALPATTLVDYCYYQMFEGCTSLTQAPALPATTLAGNCYFYMFFGCTGLTQAPALPATTLTEACYFSMFQNCTALTQAPALPATTLATNCYAGMFQNCTALTQAPALPATTLKYQCYAYMFRGCTSLTQAPTLSATTLADRCYYFMFLNCTALTQAPALPATMLANYCYNSMFRGCTSLKLSSSKTGEYTQEYRIPSSGTGTTATDALTDMFTSTGGAFTGTPEINTTYYLSSDNMIVHETEIATLNGYVGSMIDVASVQPDWNQNDETAPDYVKNRPFYTGGPVETVIIEERTESFSDSGMGWYSTSFQLEFSATIGETYKVYWDGAAYECTCVECNGAPVIGNLSIPGQGSDTGEPFVITVIDGTSVYVYAADTASSHTFSINGFVPEVVKIDRKYLPTTFKPEGKSYLTFSSPNSFTLGVHNATKYWDGTLEYFASDETWTTWDGTSTLSSVDNNGNNVLYLRGTGNTVITGNIFNSNWALTGTHISCIGNIENLLDYATVASGNHPTMADNCYQEMFRDCTALTRAPDLPATTLANNCYSGIFQGCTSLTQAPELPATTLTDHCYYQMFRGCTSLTQAPVLPAITLAGWCYSSMFSKCTALTQAPALPATTLADYCYFSMFFDCTSLTQAPTLSATTLSIYCYNQMFQGCTSLIKAPALPATTLADRCYEYMFKGCTGLKLSSTKTGEYIQEYRIPTIGTGTTATNALANMFTNTGGNFLGAPSINTTYYLSTDNMIVRDTEVATLNGYVGSMIDAAIGNAIGGSY